MCILADRTANNNNQLSGGTEGPSISSPCTCPAGNVDGETQTDVVVVDLGVRMRSSYSDEEDDDGRDRQSHWKRIKTRSESHSDSAGERFRFMGHSRDNSHSHDRSLGGGGGGKRLLLLPTQKGNATDQHQQRQASRRMILEKIAGSRHLSSYDDDEPGDRRRTGSIIKGWDVSSMGRGGHHQHSDGGTNINTTCKKKDTDYSRAVMKRKHTEAASFSVDDGNRRRISSPEHHNSRVMMYHGGSMIMTTREENNKHMARRHFVDTAATQGYETRVSSSCSSGVADVGRFNGEDQIHFVENFGHSDDDGDVDDGFVSIRRERARIATQDLRETLNARLRRSESLKRENLNNRVEFVVDDLLQRGPPKGGGIQLRSNGTVTQGSLVKKLPSNCGRSRRPLDDDCQGFAKTTGSGSLGLERSKGDMESDERHHKEKGRTRWAEKERDDLEKENLAKAAAEVKSVTVVDYSHKFTVAKAPATIPEKPVEADPHRLCQRQKQIDYGKNTLGYERYTEAIPRYMRTKAHPRTPDIRQVCSKRSWDGQIRKWRRLLHEYDPPKGEDEEDPDQLFVPTRRQDSLKGSTTDDSIMDTQSEGDKLVEDADLKIYDGWSDEEC